jgi:alginate O-acetyltransferase complex protein AlgI
MLFNSFAFLIFFPVVTIGYFALPHRWRWLWLLLASCYFYMAFIPAYIFILFFTIGVDYISGRMIEMAIGRRRKLFLMTSLAANIGVLAVFKYFNFFNENIAALTGFLGVAYPIPSLSLLLPIGLSFHTFQSMSYTIEVYRGRQMAERNLGILALYVMFYPQLVAGPIERPQNLLPQFRIVHSFDPARATEGLQRMLWGFFKKVVIADRLAIVVNQVYGHPQDYSGVQLIVATVCFAYQIYCDFSGYADIAIGSAHVMGFRLMENFDRPYHSLSIAEFWRRWNISLSSWFRDYLYIPLGGNRVSRPRWAFNVLVTFLISGLWHGANWTFILWGGLNGVYLIVGELFSPFGKAIAALRPVRQHPRAWTALQLGTTFSLVCISWIFFRAATLGEALYILTNLFRGVGGFARGLFQPGFAADKLGSMGLEPVGWLVLIGSVALLEAIELVQRRGTIPQLFSRRPLWMRWIGYYALLLIILIFGVFGESPFIYFQF